MIQLLCSQPSNHFRTSRRLVCLCAVLVLSLCGGVNIASAQSQYFSGVQTTLGSGFRMPTGVAVDSSGNVYVADFANGAVKEILAVNGSVPASPVIRILGGKFSYPAAVALDKSGNLYVIDSGNGTVNELLAVNGSMPALPTIRTLTTVSYANGLTVDSKGNVYVAVGLIQSGNPPTGQSGSGYVLELVAVNGAVPANPQLLMISNPALKAPYGVAVDGNGNVYVADNGNNAVKEILAVNGSISTSSQVKTVTTFSGKAGPCGIALDAIGDVFVSDIGNNEVFKILAVNGSIPASPTVLTLLTVSGFYYPTGVALDKNGNLYIADAMNNRVVKVTF